MRLLKVSFKNYKILEEREFEFGENPFVFSASNETGKSTLIEGIADAFSLSPDKLRAKRTEGKEMDPVLEVTFEIGEHTYALKINAQDGTVRLLGSDGTDLGRPRAIEDFLERKGYRFFSAVLNGLLVMRERDLTTETGKGLRDLLDTVLKSASIEQMTKLLDGMLLQRAGTQRFKSRPFGKEEESLREQLKRTEDRLAETIKRHEEHRKSRDQLERVQRELDRKIQAKTALEAEIERDRRLLSYAVCEQTRTRIDDLAERIGGIERQLEQYRRREEEKTREKEDIKKQENGILERFSELNRRKPELSRAEQELEKTKQRIELLRNIEELNQKLGEFRDRSSEELRSDLVDWKTYQGLCQESRGIIRVLQAKDRVVVGDSVTMGPGEAAEFKGEALIRYRDLTLQVYTSQKIEKGKKKVQELAKTYGSIETLKGLIGLLEQRELLSAQLDGDEDLTLLQGKAEALLDQIEELKRMDEEMREKEGAIRLLRQRFEEVEKELRDIQRAKSELELDKQRSEDEKHRQEESLKSLEKEIEHLTLREAKEFEEECSRVDIEDLKARIDERESRLDELRDEIAELQAQKRACEVLTEKEPDKKELDELLSQKRELEERLRRMMSMERALRFGLEVLAELRAEINRRYLKEFESSVSELFSRITGGNYTSVRFKTESLFFDGNTFKTRWTAVRRDGGSFPINELSDGTSSQLLLAARLALIRLFFDREAFLLLDEPFAYFDRDRTRRTLDILHSLARQGWQVVVMSAKEGIP